MTPHHGKSIQPGPSPAPSLIRLSDVLNIIRQRWYIGLVVGLIVAGIVAYNKFQEPPRYRSSATLVIEINPEKTIELKDVSKSGGGSQYDSIIKNYLERLRSRTMADFVQANLTTKQAEIFRNAYPGISSTIGHAGFEVPEIAGVLQRSISSSWNPETQIVNISATHGTPQVAKIIVDAYCSAFIQLQSNRLEERTERTLAFLQKQSEELQAKLEDGEAVLQQYRSENDLISIEGNIDLISQRLGTLNSALTAQKVALISAKNILSQILEAKGDNDRLMQISAIAGRTRVADIKAKLELEKSERGVLSQTYGARHPKMQTKQAAIESLESSLQLAIDSSIQELKKEIEVLETGYASLQAEMKSAEAEALELDRLAIDYRVLQRKLGVQRQIFDVLSEQFTATDITSQFDTTSIIVLDPAYYPGKPFAPNPEKIIMMAGFLFIACFVGIPMAMEFFDNRLKTFSDIENFIGKQVFGNIKKISKNNDSELAMSVSNNDEEISEAFREIYSSLKLETGCHPPYSLIITSSLPSEGKTFIACNLAQIFSRHQLKVILIDCDFRRPSVHRQLKIGNENGVIEWVYSDTPLPTTEDPTELKLLGITEINPNFFVLPSGGSTKDPTEIIGHDRFNRLMSRLKDSFDIIIIDTPPSVLFPDASLLTDFAQQTLFVAKQNAVTRQKARFAVNRLERTNAPVIGIVLNYISNHSVVQGYGQANSYGYSYERDGKNYKKYYAKSPD